MRKLFITLLAVGLLSIMADRHKIEIHVISLTLTTGVSCHFQSGESWISSPVLPS